MKVSHSNLDSILDRYYDVKVPLYITGGPGIGKSWRMFNFAARKAGEAKRELLDWNRTPIDKKRSFSVDKEKHKGKFVFVDIRLSQKDPVDLSGLPNRVNSHVEWSPNLTFKALEAKKDIGNESKAESDVGEYADKAIQLLRKSNLNSEDIFGVILLDELPQAPVSVQFAAYQLILDNCMGELEISPNICIVAAGNRPGDRANINPMPMPLRNRFGHVELLPPTEKEFYNWGTNNGIDDTVLAFLMFKPEYVCQEIAKIKDKDTLAFATPRSWHRASDLIKGVTENSLIGTLVGSQVGEGIGYEFNSFRKMRDELNIEDILDNPEKAGKLTIDLVWCLISALPSYYAGREKDQLKTLGSILDVCSCLKHDDFAVALLRMLKVKGGKKFLSHISQVKNGTTVMKKYVPYLTD